MDLNGAVALVTGGNGGLGQRICHALAKEGVHVAVMMRRAATTQKASPASWPLVIRSTPRLSAATLPIAPQWSRSSMT